MSNATAHTACDNHTPTRSHRDFRRNRRIQRNVRLHQQLKDLITACSACRYIGGNPIVEAIAEGLGFAPHDLAIIDVKVNRRIVTLVVVPPHIWNSSYPSAKVIDLRFQAREAGQAAVIVPQGVVEREPRLGNSQLLARTANIKIDATCRMSVLAYLIEHGASCLSELAELVKHPDPFGAVLSMVATGAIALDLHKPITPYTPVDIPSPTPVGKR